MACCLCLWRSDSHLLTDQCIDQCAFPGVRLTKYVNKTYFHLLKVQNNKGLYRGLLSCERRDRTSDLRVMSPTSYRCSISRYKINLIIAFILRIHFTNRFVSLNGLQKYVLQTYHPKIFANHLIFF